MAPSSNDIQMAPRQAAPRLPAPVQPSAFRMLLATAAALVLIAAAGYVHGVRTDRWRPSIALQHAMAKVQGFPQELGEWHGTNLDPDGRTMQRAGASAFMLRDYQSTGSESKAKMHVLLLCGRSGPMSVHTPEVCYGSAGYEMVGKASRLQVPMTNSKVTHEVFTADLRKPGGSSDDTLRLCWAWASPEDRKWRAPADPRLEFKTQRALYKVYIIPQVPAAEQGAETDPLVPFLQQFFAQFGEPTPSPSPPSSPPQ
jgi:hypothetical protein